MADQSENNSTNSTPSPKSGGSWFSQIASSLRGIGGTTHQAQDNQPQISSESQASPQVEISFKPVSALNLIYQFSNWVDRGLPLKELMDNLTRGLVLNMRFDYAAYYVVNPLTQHAELLNQTVAEGKKSTVSPGFSIALTNDSILGWVYHQQRERVVYDLQDMPFIYKDWLMAESASEATFPVFSNNQIVGLIDLQSHEPDVFVGPTLDLLRTLTTFLRSTLSAEEKFNLPSPVEDQSEQVKRLIGQTRTEVELFSLLRASLMNAPFVSVLFAVKKDHLALQFISDAKRPTSAQAIQGVAMPLENTVDMLVKQNPVLFERLDPNQNANQVLSFFTRRGCTSSGMLGILENGQVTYILALGGFEEHPITAENLQPLVNLAQISGETLQQIHLVANLQSRLVELEALASITQSISAETDLQKLFQNLHENIKPLIGEDVSFAVSIFHPGREEIEIPYMTEDGNILSFPSFPLGEGLTSVLIRTRKPLLIVKDTEQQIALLGAKIQGKPARSWMGVPLILGSEVIGTMFVQDTEHEERFDESDLHLFQTLAPQVAVAIRNAELFSQVDHSLGQHRLLHQITVATAAASSVEDALTTTVKMLNEGLPGSRVSVFLLDEEGNLVVQSYAGFKSASLQGLSIPLGQGIIGTTAAQAQTMVVNDVTSEPNYLNLEPEIQSEMAVPITFMGRVLGVLDIEFPVKNAFETSAVEIIGTLGSNLGAVVSSARLLETVRLQVERQQQLFEVTSKIRRSVDMKSIMETSASELGKILGARRVSIRVSPPIAEKPSSDNGSNPVVEVENEIL